MSAVSDRVAWASGTNGTVIRTSDGGTTWQRLAIAGAEKLDFRDIDAVDDRTAYALSIGAGELSRIYKTSDAGLTWIEQFVNHDPKAFFDAMAFWDAKRGVAVSDSVDGQFVILLTSDGGTSWVRVPASALPPALPNEGFFAASGTNVTVAAPNHVWVGTGAASQARVLRSSDGGRTWALSKTPLDAGPSAGIFSIAFSDRTHGIVVGGDYKAESVAGNNAAFTTRRRRHVDADQRPSRLSLRRRLPSGRRSDDRRHRAVAGRTCRPTAAGHGRRSPGLASTRSALREVERWDLEWGRRGARGDSIS